MERLDSVATSTPAALDQALSRTINELCSELKHPAFQDEREWRIVANGHARSQIEFRIAGDHQIVPYLRVALPRRSQQSSLTRVIAGPKRRLQGAAAVGGYMDPGLDMLIARRGLEWHPSTIPYR